MLRDMVTACAVLLWAAPGHRAEKEACRERVFQGVDESRVACVLVLVRCTQVRRYSLSGATRLRRSLITIVDTHSTPL